MSTTLFGLDDAPRNGWIMPPVTFRDRIDQEFVARRQLNNRYSLRAFAAFLRVDHATLSQILRGKRGVPARCIGPWARKLKLTAEEIAVYTAIGRLGDEESRLHQERVRHWAAEALALLTEPVHRELLQLSKQPEFRGDCRWVAGRLGVSVDAVNVALSRLLRLGLLEMIAKGVWCEKTGLGELTTQHFSTFVAERMPSPLEA